MKFLFVHQNYPGQFLHIVRRLIAQGVHDVVFISEPNDNVIPGVRRVTYKPLTRPGAPVHENARDFALAMTRAEVVAAQAKELKRLGFTPDIIIGHHGWGELLNLPDVWPGAPLLGYHEFYYSLSGGDIDFDPEFTVGAHMLGNVRAKNAINLIALTNPGTGQTPTQFQRNTYPAWARPNIHMLREGVNLDLCRPMEGDRATSIGGVPIAADDRLVTYVARDLEPYRGFHQVMRSLPALLRAQPKARVILVGGDGVSYGAKLSEGTWRSHLSAELGSRLDTSRVHFPGKLDYEVYLALLQRSDAHIYYTYPFVASWSLREALACGCALVASDTDPVREFVSHGKTGILTPFFDPGALADRVGEVLEGGPRITRMRAAARAWAVANLSLEDYLRSYETLIAGLTGQAVSLAPADRSRRSSAGR